MLQSNCCTNGGKPAINASDSLTQTGSCIAKRMFGFSES
jgi:hypothetical protein